MSIRRHRGEALFAASLLITLMLAVSAASAQTPGAASEPAPAVTSDGLPPGHPSINEINTPDEAADDLSDAVDPRSLPHDLSPIGMFMGADHVVKAVIGALALASVMTWAIFLTKTLELAGVRRRALALGRRIAHARSLAEAEDEIGRRRDVGARIVRAAAEEVELSHGLSHEGIKERVVSRFDRIEAGAGRDMARGTAVLASVGSLSPFVGLFGTVWGIMNSFIGISQANTTNLAIVAPGIAEALFATGVGLVAAIPAVLFYNVFARMIAGNKAAIADVSAETLRLLSRDLDRSALRGPSRLAAAAE
ncbi:tonB-system energizer ExbB [Kaistia dalseonensis]|uniref:Biopolymer transport protein ExbB n=1 Tax=Kaistia dalseonensis TaxID=410840 RepID=A0ABU0H657_9HYPH|nr:tonB-system energizer ExbB [Kaistia dalseonensis]MCX5495190.1 tonB-system energizer ExbB [Kaistia dalseonensis]MDQ0437775.1 biopolymer transport protein ExbB [Kaistia dalseonensis]